MINKCVENFFNLVAISIDNGKIVELNKKSIILFTIVIFCSYVSHSKDFSISIHLEYISMLHFLSYYCIFFFNKIDKLV